MNTLSGSFFRRSLEHFRVLFSFQNLLQRCEASFPIYYPADINLVDSHTTDYIQFPNKRIKVHNTNRFPNIFGNSVRLFQNKEQCNATLDNIDNLNDKDFEAFILELVTKNKDNSVLKLISKCLENKRTISEYTLMTLFKRYSNLGRSDVTEALQNYVENISENLYIRHGEFSHFTAKAHCLKGNSEKGLKILEEYYVKYPSLQSMYRVIFKDLIQDVVLNRSEASMVIFKRKVLDFSNILNDHYPLIYMWYTCWRSGWYSDQVMADELFDTSQVLRNIVNEKATTFSFNILKNEYNEDAVTRLLQCLLKHKLMTEYTKVLQLFFNYKMRQRDLRGCSEIIKHCELMGIQLPADQQGRYIKLLIDGTTTEKTPTKTKIINFKFKF